MCTQKLGRLHKQRIAPLIMQVSDAKFNGEANNGCFEFVGATIIEFYKSTYVMGLRFLYQMTAYTRQVLTPPLNITVNHWVPFLFLLH